MILRLANVYGEGQQPRKSRGVISAFFKQALDDAPLEIWGSGRQQRDFVYVEDVARAVACALEAEVAPYAVFNIGSGRAVSIFDVMGEMEAIVGRKLDHDFNPEGGGHRVDVNLLCIRAAQTGLGWSPTVDLKEGLQRTWSWMRTRKPA